MSYIRAHFKTNLQVVDELLPLVKKECGGCLPTALTFEESVQRLPKHLGLQSKRNFVVSFLPCDHIESFHLEILLDVWVLKLVKEDHEYEAKYSTFDELKFDEEENSLTIYLTHDLKDYPHFHSGPNKCYFLREVIPIPLQKITIGALSINSFEWAKKNLQEFLLKSLGRHLVLVKQYGNLGEVFIQTDLYKELSMLMILESWPVMQGLVTRDTMVVVSDIHQDDLDKWKLKRLKSKQGSGKIPLLPLLKMPGTQAAALKVQNICMDEPDGGMLRIKPEPSNKLLISVLKFPYHCSKLSLIDYEIIVDIDNKIWITKATMNDLQLNMGTWVRVSTVPLKKSVSTNDVRRSIELSVSIDESLDENQTPKIKLAQVFPMEERQKLECLWQDQNSMLVQSDDMEFKNGTAYISPVFLFNILPSHLDDVKSQTLSIERAEVGESPPFFAHEISISLISSPWMKNPSIYDPIFAKHFATPRLVSPEDVLCIYCDWKDLDILNTQGTVDENLPRSHMLYCKVNYISGPNGDSLSYFVDSAHSKLFQTSSKQSYIPTMAEHFVQNSDKMRPEVPSFWLTTHPCGLDHYVTKLENILKALLLNHATLGVFPVLVRGPTGVGKKTVVMATSRRLHVQVIKVNCYEICGETTAAAEARLRNMCQKAFFCAPCILMFDNIECLDKVKDLNDKEPRIVATLMLNLEEIQKVSPYPVLVVGTTSKHQNMTSDLRSCFLDEIEVQAPSEAEREEMLQALSTGYLISPGVSFKSLASRTAGLVLADFCALFSKTVIQAQKDVMTYCKKLGLLIEESWEDEELTNEKYFKIHKKSVNLQKDICSAGILLHQSNFDKAISILQAAHSDSIGAPKIPNVSWHDIGGLSNVKQEILNTIQLPFQYPELFDAGLQRSGILLYGPPGTGKTLVAKAVATECSLNFLSVKGPELINMYVGQSEENVREIFSTAARAAPCVIFFDELDSLAPNRGRSGDSGGVMDRVVSQLLAELDGMQKSRDVFVIGATNRPDLLDPALLRPGRFDTLLYLGITKEKEDRLKIMKALTRKFCLSKDVDLERIVENSPENLTGADFYALCSTALQNAIRRKIQEGNTDGGQVELIEEDFEEATINLVPSVSQSELTRYKKIQRQFANEKRQHSQPVIKKEQGELELDGPPEGNTH